MKKITKIIGLLLASLISCSLQAADFAEEKVVLQISDGDPFKQTLVLNVANNLIKHYGPDKIDVEIVAFGPGLRLLFDGNANSKRIDGLTQNNVRFAACNNTVTSMGKALGAKPKLHGNAKVVSAGVVRIMELQNKGYKLVKP